MRLRDKVLPGLLLVAFPALACAQQVTGVTGVSVGVGSISWTWNNVPTASSYTVRNARTGALLCTGAGQAGDPAGGVPGVNVCVQTGLGTNTTQSIMVGTVISGATQNPLKASTTLYTLTLAPQPTSPAIDSVSENGFVAHFSTGTNPAYTSFFGAATPITPSGGAAITDEVVGANQIGFGNLAPNTEYKAEVFSFTGGAGDFEGDDVNSPTLVVGTTVTWAKPPNTAQVLLNTPSSLGITWGSNGNPTDTAYQVRYSTDGFATHSVTPIPFSSNFTGNSTTLTGLLTGRNYTIHVTARNRNFRETAPLVFPLTQTQGGGQAGTIVQTVAAGAGATITGTLAGDKEVTIRVPPAAFNQQVQLTIATHSVVTDLALQAACGAIDSAVDITVNPPLQPSVPVEIGFTVFLSPPQTGVTTPSRIILSRYDPGSGTCVPLPSSQNVSGNLVLARTSHFSTFVAQQVSPAGDLSRVRIFPNPFYVRKQALLTMDGLPAGARVRIFTMRGEAVFDGNANGAGILGWDGNNKSGLQVASGLFLAVVQNGDSRKVLKVAVIR